MLARALILALAATPAAADPVSIGGILIAAASTAGAAAVSSTALAVGITIAGGLATLGLQMAFAPSRPRQPEVIRELARAQSLPPKRFAYGRTKLYGSPAPYTVRGDVLYGALILNSRPSAGGTVEIAIDKTPVTLSGNLFNFAGAGAAATNAPFANYARFWLSLGDQTQPPQAILDDADSPFLATDAWRGQTVLWMRLEAGPSRSRAERWKRVPPDVEVVMDWSRVRDWRDPSQTDDPATWAFSRNRAMILLDALMTNPARPYPIEQIDLESFIARANEDDQAVPLKSGGTEPRYRADGVVVWRGDEIETQVTPIAEAGAGRLARVGGKLALTPGVWIAPAVTLTDILGDELAFEVLKPGRDLASVVACRYVAPDRDYEMADLAAYRVPGATGPEAVMDIELPFVSRATQAMRVQKIIALRQRQQKRLTSTFPPTALALLTGSTATVALPAPYGAMNGTYECQSIAPVTTLAGDGVAMRCPAELVEASPTVYAWNPAEDEQTIEGGVAVALDRLPVTPPAGPLLLTTGASAALDTGDAVVPRILARWTPTTSARAIGYEVEFRPAGGAWQSGGAVDIETLDGDGDAFAFIGPVSVGTAYEVRVRAAAPGSVSTWLVGGPITAAGPDVTLNAPTGGDATGGDGQISVSFVAPNDEAFRGIEFWGSNTDDSGAATLLAGPIFGPANSVYGYTEDSLGAGVTRFYFARAVGPFGAISAFSASASATTNP